MHHGWHFVFSVFTLGLWAVSWAALSLGRRLHPWKCQQCENRNPIFPDSPDAPKSGGEAQ